MHRLAWLEKTAQSSYLEKKSFLIVSNGSKCLLSESQKSRERKRRIQFRIKMYMYELSRGRLNLKNARHVQRKAWIHDNDLESLETYKSVHWPWCVISCSFFSPEKTLYSFFLPSFLPLPGSERTTTREWPLVSHKKGSTSDESVCFSREQFKVNPYV